MAKQPRQRWVRAELRIVDTDEDKGPSDYGSQTLSEQTIVVPLRGEHGTLVVTDELTRSVRTMVEQADRLYPIVVETEPELKTEATKPQLDVADIPFY